jgi:hypothetical protein
VFSVSSALISRATSELSQDVAIIKLVMLRHVAALLKHSRCKGWAVVIWLQLLHIIIASGLHSCGQGFTSIPGTHSGELDSNVSLCLAKENQDGFGTFFLLSHADHAAAMVRISGSMVDTLIFHRQPFEPIGPFKSMWSANFSCLIPGVYAANVYTLLEDSSPDDFLSLKSCIRPHFLEQPVHFEWTVGLSATAEECNNRATRLRWRITGKPPEDISRIMLRFPYAHNITLDARPNWIDDNMPEIALPGLEDYVLCFIGDSQTRNLVNSIANLLGNEGCDALEAQGTKSACQASSVRYIKMNYPENFTLDNITQYECTHAYFNFGQWQLGWPTSPPWTVEKYADEVKAFLMDVAPQVLDLGVEVNWMTSCAHSIAETSVIACPAKEWRVANWIDGYNRAAVSTVQEVNMYLGQKDLVGLVDLFQTSNSLLDFTFDGAHFQGFVGAAMAKIALQHFASGLR